MIGGAGCRSAVQARRMTIKETPSEYLPNLIQIVRLFCESTELKPAKTCFCQGWKEAMANDTRPVFELLEGIDAE